jgi:predicted dehydrogenase
VHHWHPGQRWIWEPGGFGVFDPGINALSLLTEILPMDVCVEAALLEFPENQQSPIAANVRMRTEDGVEIGADFDFRQKGEQSWDIELTTTSGKLKLAGGGAELYIDNKAVTRDASMAGEYPRLYERFASLCEAGKSEVDWRPFQLVADAFLIGERRIVAPHEI